MAYPDEFERVDWTVEYPKAAIETSISIDSSVSDKLDIETT